MPDLSAIIKRVEGLTKLEAQVLAGFSDDPDFGYSSFRNIAKHSGVELRHIRATVRRLARKGYAQYAKGLFSEDGDVRGAGYALTGLGVAALRARAAKGEP